MSYIDGTIAAVPEENKDAYIEHARRFSEIAKENGAEQCFEGWGTQVPEGKVTDFYRAVQARKGEVIVFSWIRWPDRKTHDEAWDRMMQDPRIQGMKMPYDGQRMIFGQFESVFES